MIKKQILITGGGAGIGRVLAKRFAAKVWQVIIVGRCSKLLQDVVSQYPESIRTIKEIIFHNHYKNLLRFSLY